MDIQKEIINTIDLLIEKRLSKLTMSRDIPSVVTDIDGDKYIVNINGGKQKLKCGTNLTLSKGSTVWVHIPNGDFSKAFILSKR